MFAELTLGAQDQAARAAVALLVNRSIKGAQVLVNTHWPLVLHCQLEARGFRATTTHRWEQYSDAIARNLVQEGEKATNRRWADYPSDIKAAARELANSVQDEMATQYEEAMRAMPA